MFRSQGRGFLFAGDVSVQFVSTLLGRYSPRSGFFRSRTVEKLAARAVREEQHSLLYVLPNLCPERRRRFACGGYGTAGDIALIICSSDGFTGKHSPDVPWVRLSYDYLSLSINTQRLSSKSIDFTEDSLFFMQILCIGGIVSLTGARFI